MKHKDMIRIERDLLIDLILRLTVGALTVLGLVLIAHAATLTL